MLTFATITSCGAANRHDRLDSFGIICIFLSHKGSATSIHTLGEFAEMAPLAYILLLNSVLRYSLGDTPHSFLNTLLK